MVKVNAAFANACQDRVKDSATVTDAHTPDNR